MMYPIKTMILSSPMGRVGLVPCNKYGINRIVERLNAGGHSAGCAIVFANGDKEFITDMFDVLISKIDKEAAANESPEQLASGKAPDPA